MEGINKQIAPTPLYYHPTHRNTHLTYTELTSKRIPFDSPSLLPSTSHAFPSPPSKPPKTEPNIHPLLLLFSFRWDDLLNTRSSGESSPPRLTPRPRFVLPPPIPSPSTSHVFSLSRWTAQADHPTFLLFFSSSSILLSLITSPCLLERTNITHSSSE